MDPYESHDFGFGVPKAIRWPNLQIEGFVFVFPSRSKLKGYSSDEGVEVCICLEETCQTRLMGDEQLLRFAAPRGISEST
jgi:hypothetical protein